MLQGPEGLWVLWENKHQSYKNANVIGVMRTGLANNEDK